MSQQRPDTSHDPRRRHFLKTLGAGTAAAAGLGHVTLVQAESATPDTAEAPRRYHESEHIRAYYATLRD
ncbi:twin-arginine translocation signal domain-containing protein [Halomonas sp. 328]|uniref:twin-arginine translocation signal domain-containing protein n=1 Tax=Halomonas sp. 328 TaxID=2776704 RepID=UPI0018A745B0|nr:twin-arginine translocation signal domain-containing protein [Halomonas sp. 328]MBF8221591.1 twin-arginine translocation signal domain-containing protein [Halomonas sp. 328]